MARGGGGEEDHLTLSKGRVKHDDYRLAFRWEALATERRARGTKRALWDPDRLETDRSASSRPGNHVKRWKKD